MADNVNGLIFSAILLDNSDPSPGHNTDGDGPHNNSAKYINLQTPNCSAMSLDGFELWSDDKGPLYAFGSGDLTEGTQGSNNPGTPGVPCFVAGTMVLTPDGERPVESLRVGELIATRDNGPQPIQWMAAHQLGPNHFAANPELRPVILEARWAKSARRTLLSPQHGVVVKAPGLP